MKPRITYPRTVVLAKDLEELWTSVKAEHPAQSFNGWVSDALRMNYAVALKRLRLDKHSDEA